LALEDFLKETESSSMEDLKSWKQQSLEEETRSVLYGAPVQCVGA